MELNKRREIPDLQAIIYYFVYLINTLLTKRIRLYSRFQKKTRCHSMIALNRTSDVSAGDGRSQTREKLL